MSSSSPSRPQAARGTPGRQHRSQRATSQAPPQDSPSHHVVSQRSTFAPSLSQYDDARFDNPDSNTSPNVRPGNAGRQHPSEQYSGGRYAGDRHAASPYAGLSYAAGGYATGPHAADPYAAGPYAASPHVAGPHTGGPHTGGSYAADPYTGGSYGGAHNNSPPQDAAAHGDPRYRASTSRSGYRPGQQMPSSTGSHQSGDRNYASAQSGGAAGWSNSTQHHASHMPGSGHDAVGGRANAGRGSHRGGGSGYSMQRFFEQDGYEEPWSPDARGGRRGGYDGPGSL